MISTRARRGRGHDSAHSSVEHGDPHHGYVDRLAEPVPLTFVCGIEIAARPTCCPLARCHGQ